MKRQICILTLGSKLERLAKWQAVHNQLLRDDPQFRKRHTAFLITIVFLSCPLLAVYGFYFGVGLPSFAANLAVILFFTAAMIYVILRHLHFTNQRIASYLRSSHDN